MPKEDVLYDALYDVVAGWYGLIEEWGEDRVWTKDGAGYKREDFLKAMHKAWEVVRSQ